MENGKQKNGISLLSIVFLCFFISLLTAFIGHFFVFPIVEQKFFLVEVPELKNLTINEVEDKLNKLKLKYEIKGEIETEEIDTGKVVAQTPLPYTSVKKNSKINIIISKGVSTYPVPQIKFKPLEEAKNVILSSGLLIGKITEVESAEFPPGIVVDSIPTEGVNVKKGTSIDLIVSKKISKKLVLKTVSVPNIIGKTLIEAKRILDTTGLKLGKIEEVTLEDKEFDIIVSQTPSAGKKVPENSLVNVVINVEEK